MLLDTIVEIIRANGWEKELVAELLPADHDPSEVWVQVRRRSSAQPPGPSDVVNVYQDGVTFPDQVMHECLRFLRTGRPGI